MELLNLIYYILRFKCHYNLFLFVFLLVETKLLNLYFILTYLTHLRFCMGAKTIIFRKMLTSLPHSINKRFLKRNQEDKFLVYGLHCVVFVWFKTGHSCP